jgi:mannosyltransferase
MRARHLQALVGLAALAAALRFSTLGVQSFWFDEAVTVRLVELDLRAMLERIPDSESTPPLYYLLAFGWGKLFGTGEAGLRSLSALLGTVTVPVAYAAARALVSQRAGMVAAALAAVNPFLVWYSQEARAYALLVLLGALSFLFFAHARRDPSGRALWLWALFSALALTAHYFAVFLVAPEAALLLAGLRQSAEPAQRGPRRRRVLTAALAVAGVGAALLPLALAQRSHAEYISDTSLASRLVEAPKQYLIGFDGPLETLCALVAAALVLVGLWLLARRGSERERRGAAIAGTVGGIALGIPMALALVGVDYLLARNLIAGVVPLVVALSAGLGARGAGRAGPAATAALCVLSGALVVSVPFESRFQRDDWRAVADALGTPPGQRAVVVTPGNGATVLDLYLPAARPLRPAGRHIDEIAVVGLSARGTGESSEPPRTQRVPVPSQFREFVRREAETFTVLRFRSSKRVRYSGSQLVARRLGDERGAVLLQNLFFEKAGGRG